MKKRRKRDAPVKWRGALAGTRALQLAEQHIRDNRHQYSPDPTTEHMCEYQTPGSKNSSYIANCTHQFGEGPIDMKTAVNINQKLTVIEWLTSESQGFLGPGIIPTRNIFSGR